MLQALVGLAIGVPAAIASVRLVSSQLYEIKAVHMGVLAGAVAALIAAAAVAGLIPARRAASIDPARALRTE
jgi:ABC-type antimicrobial peptide transport system permease subunit